MRRGSIIPTSGFSLHGVYIAWWLVGLGEPTFEQFMYLYSISKQRGTFGWVQANCRKAKERARKWSRIRMIPRCRNCSGRSPQECDGDEPRLPPLDPKVPPKLPFGMDDVYAEGVEKMDFSELRRQKKEVKLAMHRQEVPLVNVF
ncbi:unnamed protein product, partial [Prunus brigantina]